MILLMVVAPAFVSAVMAAIIHIATISARIATIRSKRSLPSFTLPPLLQQLFTHRLLPVMAAAPRPASASRCTGSRSAGPAVVPITTATAAAAAAPTITMTTPAATMFTSRRALTAAPRPASGPIPPLEKTIAQLPLSLRADASPTCTAAIRTTQASASAST